MERIIIHNPVSAVTIICDYIFSLIEYSITTRFCPSVRLFVLLPSFSVHTKSRDQCGGKWLGTFNVTFPESNALFGSTYRCPSSSSPPPPLTLETTEVATFEGFLFPAIRYPLLRLCSSSSGTFKLEFQGDHHESFPRPQLTIGGRTAAAANERSDGRKEGWVAQKGLVWGGAVKVLKINRLVQRSESLDVPIRIAFYDNWGQLRLRSLHHQHDPRPLCLVASRYFTFIGH